MRSPRWVQGKGITVKHQNYRSSQADGNVDVDPYAVTRLMASLRKLYQSRGEGPN